MPIDDQKWDFMLYYSHHARREGEGGLHAGGYEGAEEYRAIQALAREGQHQEAASRALRALETGPAGRRQSARLHALLCRILLEQLEQHCPAAVLHGEEAARLAGLLRDPWLKCEALTMLVELYCRLGESARARAAGDEIALEVAANPGVIPGGEPALCLLQARVAEAAGSDERCLSLLQKAERLLHSGLRPALPLLEQVRLRRAEALLRLGRLSEVRALLQQQTQLPAPDWAVVEAWLALAEGDPRRAARLAEGVLQGGAATGHAVDSLAVQALAEQARGSHEAAALALAALERARAAGRADLLSRLRGRLGGLAEPSL